MNQIKPEGSIAFFYTDGGVRPVNPGFGASGVHGYVFSEVSKKPVIIADHFNTFTNKSAAKNMVPKATPTNIGYRACDKDGKVAGRNLENVSPDFYLDSITSFGPKPITNNYAELYAILMAFRAAEQVQGLTELHICADSQYALNCVFVWGDNWREKNWVTGSQEPVSNKEIIQELLEHRDALKAKGVKIIDVKIKGHGDDVGNNSADYLATIGCFKSIYAEQGSEPTLHENWSVGKNYWTGDVERHPLLHGRRFLYNRKVENIDTKEMFMIEPGATDLTIGKRDHEGYALVRLNKPCEIYEGLIRAQSRFGQDENWPMVVTTDRLYNKFVQRYMGPHGEDTVGPGPRGSGLFYLDGGPIAVEHNPPLLIYRVLEAHNTLKDRLDEYITKTGDFDVLDFPEDYHGISGIDITADFYDTVEKKTGKDVREVKVLRAEIEVGYSSHFVEVDINIEGKTVQKRLPLTLGMDLPPRNALKKIESEQPRITLITWRAAPGSFQYACVVECLSGVGIWSNYYCDRFFV